MITPPSDGEMSRECPTEPRFGNPFEQVIGVRQRALTRSPRHPALYAFSKAVAEYCRLLAARVEEDDPESIERFRKAVAPIDEYRSRAPRNGEDTTHTTDATEETQQSSPTPNPAPTPVVAPTPSSSENDPTNVD